MTRGSRAMNARKHETVAQMFKRQIATLKAAGTPQRSAIEAAEAAMQALADQHRARHPDAWWARR